MFLFCRVSWLSHFNCIYFVSSKCICTFIPFNCFNCFCISYCLWNSKLACELFADLKHGRGSNCDSMGCEGSLLLLEHLLTPTVLLICIIYVPPVLGVINKDCTEAEASQHGHYRVILSCSTEKNEELMRAPLRHLQHYSLALIAFTIGPVNELTPMNNCSCPLRLKNLCSHC